MSRRELEGRTWAGRVELQDLHGRVRRNSQAVIKLQSVATLKLCDHAGRSAYVLRGGHGQTHTRVQLTQGERALFVSPTGMITGIHCTGKSVPPLVSTRNLQRYVDKTDNKTATSGVHGTVPCTRAILGTIPCAPEVCNMAGRCRWAVSAVRAS